MNPKKWLKSAWESKTLWMAVLVPVLLAPLPIVHPTSEAKAGYCVIIIAYFWVTEIIPLAVTSLFPVFLFPLFGIMKAKDVCRSYMKDTVMLFLGSLVVAVAVERWNLHKRLALRTLTLVGTQPRWLMLGIMFPTWFMSMWMSNTATCAMMMPIVLAILSQIKQTMRGQRRGHGQEGTEVTLLTKPSDHDGHVEDLRAVEEAPPIPQEQEESEDREFDNLAKVFSLCTAYSANIGGIATLTGTPPNVIFKGLADGLYEEYGGSNPVNFANWLSLGLPLSFIIFMGCWGWMQVYGQGLRCFRCCEGDNSYDSVKQTLWTEYRRMGNMTFAEGVVMVNFIILALLWITRNPGFIPGWGMLFEKGFVKDSTPAVLIGCVLFILPAYPPRWLARCIRKRTASANQAMEAYPAYQPILSWRIVNEKLAWGVLLLMGGGFALADGCQVSGLSKWMSDRLESVGNLEPWVNALLLSTFLAMATEVTSNSATTTLFVPIVGELAVKLGVNPLYFMIPCTVATSLAFLLPVATPPNAIVFASGYLRVKDMALGGIPMNIMSLIALNLALNSWVAPVYDLFSLPDIFKNSSTSSTFLTTIPTTLGTGPLVNITGGP